jgi:hypothetical protein
MVSKFLSFIILTTLIGCNNNNVAKIKEEEIRKLDSFKKTLIGKYGAPNCGTVGIEISYDSIIIGDKSKFNYFIDSNSLVFKKPDLTVKLVDIKVSNDTLSFEDQDYGYTTYGYRCKN